MKRAGAIALGLTSLLVLAVKVGFMLLGLVVITADDWLNRLEQWISVRAAILAGDALPVFEDDTEIDEPPCQCIGCETLRAEGRIPDSTPKE